MADLAPHSVHASGLPVELSCDRIQAGQLPVSWHQAVIKRGIDITLATLALVFLFPLLVCIFLAVLAKNHGSALTFEIYLGRGGKTFRLYKFRTSGADHTARPLRPSERYRLVLDGFLLRYHINELPQLLNVLFGDLSLVGPRPQRPHTLLAWQADPDLGPICLERLKVRPGITGWAQIQGHCGLSDDLRQSRKQVAHDIAYLQNYSLRLDLKILWTALVRELNPEPVSSS